MAHHRERQVGGHLPLAPQVLAQRLTPQRFGDHVGSALQLAEAQDLDDVRIVEPREQLGFPPEPQVCVLGRDDARREELHDHLLAARRVLGEIDAGRGALVDEALDLEAVADHRSGHPRLLVAERIERDDLRRRLERFGVVGAEREIVADFSLTTGTEHFIGPTIRQNRARCSARWVKVA
jgi:hypothetical protein